MALELVVRGVWGVEKCEGGEVEIGVTVLFVGHDGHGMRIGSRDTLFSG